jgi:hypothetical protein
MRKLNSRGQMTIANAPQIVLIVGLAFLLMATMAYVGQKYGEAFTADESATVTNETLTTVTEAGEQVAGSSQCNFESFAVTQVLNSTDGATITSGNYTTDSDGYVYFATGGDTNFNNTNWKVSYTYSYTGTSCNITNDLQSELSDNTSIAGIVLTISLVGIVLSVLIGVFVMGRSREI